MADDEYVSSDDLIHLEGDDGIDDEQQLTNELGYEPETNRVLTAESELAMATGDGVTDDTDADTLGDNQIDELENETDDDLSDEDIDE